MREPLVTEDPLVIAVMLKILEPIFLSDPKPGTKAAQREHQIRITKLFVDFEERFYNVVDGGGDFLRKQSVGTLLYEFIRVHYGKEGHDRVTADIKDQAWGKKHTKSHICQLLFDQNAPIPGRNAVYNKEFLESERYATIGERPDTWGMTANYFLVKLKQLCNLPKNIKNIFSSLEVKLEYNIDPFVSQAMGIQTGYLLAFLESSKFNAHSPQTCEIVRKLKTNCVKIQKSSGKEIDFLQQLIAWEFCRLHLILLTLKKPNKEKELEMWESSLAGRKNLLERLEIKFGEEIKPIAESDVSDLPLEVAKILRGGLPAQSVTLYFSEESERRRTQLKSELIPIYRRHYVLFEIKDEAYRKKLTTQNIEREAQVMTQYSVDSDDPILSEIAREVDAERARLVKTSEKESGCVLQ